MKKIFLDDLPRYENGANKGNINWTECIGLKTRFIYEDIEGYVEIISYESKRQMLTIKYNEEEFNIKTNGLCRCKLGNLLGKKTKEYKIEIGTRFKDNKRDITIIDRKYKIIAINDTANLNEKMYKYECNICGYSGNEHYKDGEYQEEYYIKERGLLTNGYGCACCSNDIVVEDINSIVTTAPWMIPYFQGGYEEAKKYSCRSHSKIYPMCPYCGRIKSTEIAIDNIYKNHSIGCSCSDKIPYPEKFAFSILEQLEIDFQTQLSKTTFKWITGNKRYDFYFKLNNEQILTETHGMQHYEDCGWSKKDDVQANDKLKKELALSNGIKEENYIVIDCRYSELKFIKNSILNNEKMNKHFDLSKIDWLKCHEFAVDTRVKEACDIKNNNPNLTIKEISKIMKISNQVVKNFIKQGTELNWVVQIEQ